MKADSTGTVEATNDPRLAELCFIVIFAVEDDMVSLPPQHLAAVRKFNIDQPVVLSVR